MWQLWPWKCGPKNLIDSCGLLRENDVPVHNDKQRGFSWHLTFSTFFLLLNKLHYLKCVYRLPNWTFIAACVKLFGTWHTIAAWFSLKRLEWVYVGPHPHVNFWCMFGWVCCCIHFLYFVVIYNNTVHIMMNGILGIIY